VGELLAPVGRPPPRFAVALVNPLIHISTAQVFRQFVIPSPADIDYFSNLAYSMVKSHIPWDNCFNVLERAVGDAYPQIAQIEARLRGAGALCAVMSGSGPTVFGLFHDAAKARLAADAFRPDGFWAHTCAFI
jgi:4-diphosphocytidyl-2-C-methyl-D-erythritol kinase